MLSPIHLKGDDVTIVLKPGQIVVAQAPEADLTEPPVPTYCTNCGADYESCTDTLVTSAEACCGACRSRETHGQHAWERWGLTNHGQVIIALRRRVETLERMTQAARDVIARDDEAPSGHARGYRSGHARGYRTALQAVDGAMRAAREG